MKRLQDKVTVITGGNSGIGKGIAKFFHEEGAKVVIFGRNAETLSEAKAEIGKDILTVQGDITKTADILRLYNETEAKFGKIDALVANSGIGERIHIENATEADFDKMVNINYRGVFFTVKYALAHLNKNAAIVLISSCAHLLTLKRHSIYSSTKSAVMKLAKNFANDLGSKNIRVNSISPGYIETPIFHERMKTDPDYLNRRVPLIPLGKIGDPIDIARAALFLVSDEASYITGTDLVVDGGFSANFPEP